MRISAVAPRPIAICAALFVSATAVSAQQPAAAPVASPTPSAEMAQPQMQPAQMQPGVPQPSMPIPPGGPAWQGNMPMHPGMMQQGPHGGPGMMRGPMPQPGMMTPQQGAQAAPPAMSQEQAAPQPPMGYGGPMMHGPGMHPPGFPGMMYGPAMPNHDGPVGPGPMGWPMMGGPMMGGPMMGGPMMGGMCPMGGPAYAAGRLAFIKVELAINKEQEEAFDGFAQAMRKNVETMHEMRPEMMKEMMSAKTPADRLGARIKGMETRLGMMKDMKAALDKLYDKLTDEQKDKANFILPMMGCMH